MGMNCIGHIDIEYAEIERYMTEVVKKRGVCDVLPAGRFNLYGDHEPRFAGLRCSERLGGRQTGMSASGCRNCLLPEEERNRR